MSLARLICVSLLISAAGCGRSLTYKYDSRGQFPDAGRIRHLPDGGIADAGEYIPLCNPEHVDTYVLPTVRRPIDVLFVVDDSRSMRDNQQALGDNFEAFITSFKAKSVDFHLGTVTTDMDSSARSGRMVRPFLRSDGGLTDAELTTAFEKMVKVGIDGSGDEQGIAAAHAALSLPLIDSGNNKGFLRPEADLGLVFLSDEEDHSPEKVADFVTFLKGLKPDAVSLSIASIVGLEKGLTCNTGHWRYVQAAHALGPRGLVSACDPDYAATLEAVSGRLIGTNCIVGLNKPLDDNLHLRVTVDGNEWYFFRAAADSVYPNGSVELLPCPEAGGSVDIIYEECP